MFDRLLLRWSVTLSLCLLLNSILTATACGQLPVTQLRTVFPPAGQAGTTITLDVVEGDDLDELSGLIFNHPGIQQTDQPNPHNNPRRFTIQIAADVPAGYYSVRAQGKFGVSNPRMFRVESVPVQAVQEADLLKQTPYPLPIESALCSRIDAAGDQDEFAIELQAGQPYTISVDCLGIDSRLIPVVEIYDPSGKRVEFARRVEERDPQLVFIPQQTGAHRLTMKDFLFKGAVNYAYCLKVQQRLQPRAINPPVLQPSQGQQVTALKPIATADAPWATSPAQLEVLSGDQPKVLPGYLSPRQSFDPPRSARLVSEDQKQDLLPLPETSYSLLEEHEPNNSADQAQKLTVPTEVYGRFLEHDDVDVFNVSATKGQSLWLEILSERDGQGLDPYVILHEITTDAAGKSSAKQLNVPDDLATNLYPNVFDTLTDDIDFQWTAPSDATLRITLRNRFRLTPENRLDHYRLRVSTPQPHFEAVALNLPNYVTAPWTADTPSGCVLRQGGTATFKVLLHRLQGFAEPVLIEAVQTPPGITIPSIVVPPQATTGLLTLHATPEAPSGFAEIQLTASAVSATNPQQKLENYSAQPVQPAAVIWKGDTINPATSRLGHSLVVSVVPEKQPVSVAAIEHPALQHVCQGQILWQPLQIHYQPETKDIPVLTLEGLDKASKIDALVPTITSGQTAAAVKFQFPADAKVGWQTCNLRSSFPWNYVRNPELLARQSAAFDAAAKNVADQKSKLTEIGTQLTTETKSQETAKKSVTELTAQTEELKKQLTALQPQIDAQQKTLAELQDETQKTEAAKTLETLTQQKAALEMNLQTTQTKVKESGQQVAAATEKIQALQKEQAALTQTIANLEKQLAAQKTALDKVKNEQKPKALKVEGYVDHQVFEVHPAPVKLTLKSPAELTLAKGMTVEATLELTRNEGVVGPVQFTLSLPPGVSGITAEPLMLAGDQKVATFKITASPEATPGKHPFCALRATTAHHNHSLSVDVPVTFIVP